MALPYDQTIIENGTNLLDLALAGNTWSGGLLGYCMIFVPGIIFFLATRGQDTKASLAVSTFLMMMWSGMLFWWEIVPFRAVEACMAFFVGAFIYYKFTT